MLVSEGTDSVPSRAASPRRRAVPVVAMKPPRGFRRAPVLSSAPPPRSGVTHTRIRSPPRLNGPRKLPASVLVGSSQRWREQLDNLAASSTLLRQQSCTSTVRPMRSGENMLLPMALASHGSLAGAAHLDFETACVAGRPSSAMADGRLMHGLMAPPSFVRPKSAGSLRPTSCSLRRAVGTTLAVNAIKRSGRDRTPEPSPQPTPQPIT